MEAPLPKTTLEKDLEPWLIYRQLTGLEFGHLACVDVDASNFVPHFGKTRP